MIAALKGTVLDVGSASAVIDVGGIGFSVFVTPSTLGALREGHEARLHTSLVVREDSMTLFGFTELDEREVFEILQTVTGVGPKLAMTIIGTLAPDPLRKAVANADLAALTKVPGVGKKVAQRLVLEIGTKLGEVRHTIVDNETAAEADDVVQALIGLGWNEREAREAVTQAEEKLPGGSVPELLRASLQLLGARR